jgi:hypothetical protein
VEGIEPSHIALSIPGMNAEAFRAGKGKIPKSRPSRASSERLATSSTKVSILSSVSAASNQFSSSMFSVFTRAESQIDVGLNEWGTMHPPTSLKPCVAYAHKAAGIEIELGSRNSGSPPGRLNIARFHRTLILLITKPCTAPHSPSSPAACN